MASFSLARYTLRIRNVEDRGWEYLNSFGEDETDLFDLAFLVYALSVNFILTMLMILRRVHILLTKEFEDITAP